MVEYAAVVVARRAMRRVEGDIVVGVVVMVLVVCVGHRALRSLLPRASSTVPGEEFNVFKRAEFAERGVTIGAECEKNL